MSIQSPADRKAVFAAIREISGSMLRTEAERALVKDIVKNVSDAYLISKKTVKKMAAVFHRQSMTEEVAQHEEFVELYTEVTRAHTPPTL